MTAHERLKREHNPSILIRRNMNMDTGHIKLWNELTQEEKDSGRWVKLGEDEYAKAITIEEYERRNRLKEIFR